jgi:uncharacterized protein (TIGR03118 family)
MRRCNLSVLLCLSMLILAPGALPAATGYLVHNLIADQAGVANLTDPNLVNPWGIAISASSPFWLCNAGAGSGTGVSTTGISTVYTFSATTLSISSTKVSIPPAPSGGDTSCTGIITNGSTAFLVGTTTPTKASFIFSSQGGTVTGWASAVNPTLAQPAIDNSASGAVYKGLAFYNPSSSAPTGSVPRLYVPNFHTGAIEVYDGTWKPVTLAAGAFTDPKIPAGFAPFNIQYLGGTAALEGKLYVTYAKQDANKKFDVAGPGNGYVDVYDTNGNLLQSLIAGGNLNSPWGLALAMSFPTTATGTVANLAFGQYSGALLVGNFGDGTINAYDPVKGTLLGTLADQTGKTITIPGLWALQFGNGGSGGDVNSLFFTSGPGGELHGLFGSIEANPTVTASNIVNGASFGPGIAPNTWITILGSSLAATARVWNANDFSGAYLPTSLDNVTVTINGENAYPYFISPKQIDVLTPTDMPLGTSVPVVVSNGGLTSSSTVTIATANVAPAFFLFGGKYVAATHANNAYIGPTSLGTVYTPAAIGETIVLYGTGFGSTNPVAPNGQVVSGAPLLVGTPTILINNVPAQVVFAGLSGGSAGLFQFNIVVPAGLTSGDQPISASISGATSPTGVFLTIQ